MEHTVWGVVGGDNPHAKTIAIPVGIHEFYDHAVRDAKMFSRDGWTTWIETEEREHE